MPFDMPETKKREFRKANYFTMELGTHYIRFLEPTEKAAKIMQHFLPIGRGTTIRCLGDDCPVCANNRVLIAENPEKKFKDIKGLNFASLYAHINVLDRTPVKVCPNCQHEVKADVNGNYPSVCPYCITPTKQTLIVDVAQTLSNKVKVISLSKSLATQIDTQEKGKLDEKKEVIPITSYDFEIFVVPNGDKKLPAFKAHTERNDIVNVPDEMLYNTEDSVMKLTSDEIISLLKGTQLRDIFAARRGTAVSVTPITSKEDVDKVVAELMGD